MYETEKLRKSKLKRISRFFARGCMQYAMLLKKLLGVVYHVIFCFHSLLFLEISYSKNSKKRCIYEYANIFHKFCFPTHVVCFTLINRKETGKLEIDSTTEQRAKTTECKHFFKFGVR